MTTDLLPLPSNLALATELTGRYLRTTWAADDGSVLIARVQAGIRVDVDDSPRDGVAVKGPADAGPRLAAGVLYRFHGRWVRHHRHGLQFEFASFSAIVPHDRRGVVAYLVSIAEAVGERRAERLWDAFEGSAVLVLREEPERVVAAGIMSERDAKEASESLWQEVRYESVKIDLLALFAGRGFQAAKCIKVAIAKWGARAAELLRRNPYLMLAAKMPGAGFKRCDRLYLDLGHPPARLKRQALCAWWAIKSDGSGHTWIPARQVAQMVSETIPAADVVRALRLAIRGRLLAIWRGDPASETEGGKWLGEARKCFNEATVADQVRRMVAC